MFSSTRPGLLSDPFPVTWGLKKLRVSLRPSPAVRAPFSWDEFAWDHRLSDGVIGILYEKCQAVLLEADGSLGHNHYYYTVVQELAEAGRGLDPWAAAGSSKLRSHRELRLGFGLIRQIDRRGGTE